MESLDGIYKGGFFKNRYKLAWRAPILVQSILKILAPRSVLDVGCAVGELVKEFTEQGVVARGLEGATTSVPFLLVPEKMVLFHDLRLPIVLNETFDLVVCFEVAEHIEPEYADQFLSNLRSFSSRILMSAAPPGQGGHHHVNCQPYQYWIDKMSVFGYRFVTETTDRIKEVIPAHAARAKEMRAIYGNMLFFEREA